MTDKKLKELLAVIDNRYGRVRSKEECIIEIKTCVQAFGMVPDEIVEKALYAAFAECRFPKQIIVDWHVEIKKLQATVEPSANDLWTQAAAAARKIEANLYYQTHGGFIAPDGRKLKGEDFKKENAKIFAALPMVVQRWAGSPADLPEIFSSRSSADLRWHGMRSKRPFRSLIVCVSCAMVGCILTSTAYSRRVNDLETERDIYASKSSNWERMAGERDETIDQLQTEVDKLTAELNAQTDLTLTYAGAFSCTAYCSEEYAHICGEGHGITSSGAKVQPGVTVAADTSVLPYGTVVYIEGVGLRVVQDTGGAVKGNKLDVAVSTHAEALSWSGWGSRRVWIISGGIEP